jgi:2-polyprenyl-6-methoxyphenol hydroxylase-like FAD-dependent oxidoreductase
LRVGVVGAGTAGSAAALFLARAGHEVTVCERVPEPAPVGAGITLQPTGQAVLARLGLLEPVRASGAPIDRLHCTSAGGRVIVSLPYGDVASDLHGLGLHRGVLFETLFTAARREPRVDVRCGVDVTAWRRDGAARWLVTSAGELGPFDLVVVADGSVSELHPHTSISHTVKPYPWGALWFVAEDRDGTFSGELRQVVDGTRHMFGLLPTGRAPDGRAVVSLFWSLRADRFDAWRDAGLAAWKEHILRYDRRAGPLLDQITDPAQVVFARYRDVAMRGWHEPGAVFIGDAAHATSPQLGQGANLALWDAMVLADSLAAAGDGLDGGLAGYTRARRPHLGFYQLATRSLTPFFQSDSRLAGFLRDVLFPVSRWLGPLRRRMVRTMAGIERGILRRPIPLAQLREFLEKK